MNMRQLKRRLQEKNKQTRRRFVQHKRRNLLATPGVHEYIIVLDHLKPTYNIGKIFRSADAFGAREVHLVGTDFFDPGPAAGSFKWVPATFHDHFEKCHHHIRQRGYTLFALDPMAGEPLPGVDLPGKSAFVFGNEEFGLSFTRSSYPDMRTLTIPQLGKVQSLNVSIAASILMYEYIRQHDHNGPRGDIESVLPTQPSAGV